jgi:hypothetical protein
VSLPGERGEGEEREKRERKEPERVLHAFRLLKPHNTPTSSQERELPVKFGL